MSVRHRAAAATGCACGSSKPIFTDSAGEPQALRESRCFNLLLARCALPLRCSPVRAGGASAPASCTCAAAATAAGAVHAAACCDAPRCGAALLKKCRTCGDCGDPASDGARSCAFCGAHLLMTERAERHGGTVTSCAANECACSRDSKSTSGTRRCSGPTKTSGTWRSSSLYAGVAHGM